MARARLLCGSRLMLLALIMGVLMAGSTRTAAQEGDKTVWAQSGASTVLAASTIWVDATSFCGTGGGTNNCNGASFDFCTVVSKALTQLLSVSPAGGVVDARGVLPFGAGTEPCSSDPFVPLETLSLNPPVTILLPAYNIELNPTSGAGSGTWVLPNNVRLVGTGFQTVLLGAATCCYTAGYLIDMGSLTCSTGYTGIGIEHLQVVTQALATTPSTYYGGIDNECAGEGSYVSDVKISGNPSTPTALGAVGLMIGAGAVNSGPYTDIYVVAAPGNTCGSSYPSNVSCVSVLTQTRGIHGISCLGSEATGASSVSAGILVNASNNSIEDVHVESFYDGVALNDTSLGAINNIFVSNVSAGDTGACPSGGVVNAVHVYSGVTNATITEVSNINKPAYSIEDDVTGAKVENCNGTGCAFPITSGLYVLGGSEGSTAGQYTRLATTPANPTVYGGSSTVVPVWGVGSTLPSGSCYIPGTLLSYTSTGGGIYACTSGGSWAALP